MRAILKSDIEDIFTKRRRVSAYRFAILYRPETIKKSSLNFKINANDL